MTRCFGDGDDLYAAYHDNEWGVPRAWTEAELFERLALEAFQSGLSWLTILRRREGFRRAFAGFDPEVVAAFTETDVERLLADASIIRNRRKIEATIHNARQLVAMHAEGDSLARLLAKFRPPQVITRRASMDLVPATTPESHALAKELKARGFTFVGPTTAYATMQALGLVNDHIAACPSASLEDRPLDAWDELAAEAVLVAPAPTEPAPAEAMPGSA